MAALQFTAKGLTRRCCGCPELQLYVVAAAVVFGAIAFAEMVAGPLIARPDLAKTPKDVAVRVDVLENDEHLQGRPFTLDKIDAPPPQGKTEREDDRIVYDPAGAFDNLVEGKTETVNLDYSIIDDDQRTASARLTIIVEGKKTPLTAGDDEATTAKNRSIFVDVLANDNAPEGGKLTLCDLSYDEGFRGKAEIVDNRIEYDPGDKFKDLVAGTNKEESLTYTVKDDAGGAAPARLTITVQGENDGPVARDDEATTAKNNSIIIDVLANDEHPERGKLTLLDLWYGEGFRGKAEIVENRIEYDPGDKFKDLAGDTNEEESLNSLEVGPKLPSLKRDQSTSSDAAEPYASAVPPRNEVKELQKVLLDLTFDPGPIDGIIGPQTRRAITEWQRTQKLDPTGNMTNDQYRSLLDQHRYLAESAIAKEILTYFVEDDRGVADSAQLTITIRNRAPVARDDEAITSESESIVVDVLQNDADLDEGDDLKLIGFEAVDRLRGSAKIEDDRIVYDPGDSFDYLPDGATERQTFVYSIEDNYGARDLAQLTIIIQGKKDWPWSIVPPQYLRPNCGLAPTDQIRGVLYCAREDDESVEPPLTSDSRQLHSEDQRNERQHRDEHRHSDKKHGGKKHGGTDLGDGEKRERGHHRHGYQDRHHRESSRDRRKRH